MLPELSIERVFQRELDSLPLPAGQLWVPKPRTERSRIVAVSVAAAAVLLVVAAADLVREASSAASQPRTVASAPPSLPARSTCAPPAFGANGRCVTLLPNAVRNPALGYNLIIPGDWRETPMPPGTEPFVPDRPTTSLALTAPFLTAPFLLDRHVFTARSPQDWALTAGSTTAAPAWDLDVQVWDRQGRTALDWARTFGPCNFDIGNFGPTGCSQSTDTIRGLPVVVTTVRSIHGSQTTSYYLERGDQMLILRYWTDPNVAPPDGVTNTTLEGIVHSIGLV